MTELTDEALLVAFGNGDPLAARELTHRLTPKVFGLAMRLLRDRAEAEDVAQEAMLRLWRVAPDWRQGEAKVSTWLYRVVSNLCTDRLRKTRPETLPEAFEIADDTPEASETLLAQARTKALSEGLASLPDRQRQAVVLRHLEGLGNPEIATIMDIGVEAVESLIARGKRALAQRLGPRRDDLGFYDDT